MKKIGLDKYTHFFAGATIASVVCLATGGDIIGAFLGLVVATAAGLIKEWADEVADWMDAVATTLGGLLPIVAIIMRELLW